MYRRDETEATVTLRCACCSRVQVRSGEIADRIIYLILFSPLRFDTPITDTSIQLSCGYCQHKQSSVISASYRSTVKA